MSRKWELPKLFPPTKKRRIIADYEAGMSMRALGKKYDLGHERRVRPLLEHWGVKLRGRGWAEGPRHWNWKGGRERGNFHVKLLPSDPLFPMAQKNGYVLESRLVVARSLGRPLRADETVHHINGNTRDNSLANLQLRQGRHGKGVRMTCMDCGSHNVRPAEL